MNIINFSLTINILNNNFIIFNIIIIIFNLILFFLKYKENTIYHNTKFLVIIYLCLDTINIIFLNINNFLLINNIIVMLFLININKYSKYGWLQIHLIIIIINFLKFFFNNLNIIHMIIIYTAIFMCIYSLIYINNTLNLKQLIQYIILSIIAFIFFIFYVYSQIYFNGSTLILHNNIIFLNFQAHIIIYIFIIIIISIKLGLYPTNILVFKLYKFLNNKNIIFIMTIYKLFIYIIVLFLIINLLNVNIATINLINIIIMYLSILTIIQVGLLLIYQNNIKNFIIANSFIHMGNILIIIVNCKMNEQYHIFILYIFFYFLIVIIFLQVIEITPILNQQKKNILYLTSILLIICILASFPPLILFILKFYIYYYIFNNGYILVSFLILLINSTLIIYAYIKIIGKMLIYGWKI